MRSAIREVFTPVRPTTPVAGAPDAWDRIGLGVRKVVGLALSAVVAVVILVYVVQHFVPRGNISGSDTLHQDLLNSTSEPEAGRATIEPFIPTAQRSFIAVIESFIPSYNAADTEVRRTNVRFERRDALARYFSTSGSLQFQGWVGHVEGLSTERDGEAAVSVKLRGSETIIKTWSNSLSDSSSNTMISRSDSLYPSLMNIRDGDEVTVSGTFVPDYSGPDFVKEASVTEGGSIASPEFIVRFSQIRLGLPVPFQSDRAANQTPPAVAPPVRRDNNESKEGSEPPPSAERQPSGPFNMVVDGAPDCFHVVDDEVLCDARPSIHLKNRRKANYYVACDTASATCAKLTSGEAYLFEVVGDKTRYPGCGGRQNEYINAAYHKVGSCILIHAAPHDLIYSLIPQGEEND